MGYLRCLLIAALIAITNCSQTSGELQNETFEDISTRIHSIILSDHVTREIGDISHNALYCEEQEALVLMSRDNKKVFIVDMDGNLISMFGGDGRGPEEFLELTSVGKDSDCNILVYDARNHLVKKFSKSGEFLKPFLPPEQDKIWMRGGLIFSHENHFYFAMEEAGRPDVKERKTFAVADENFSDFTKYGHIDRYYVEELDDMMKQPYMVLDHHNNTIITTHRIIPYFKVFDIDNKFEMKGRYGYQSPNFLMSNTPLRRNHSMNERYRILLEKSLVEAPLATNDYLVFRFVNTTSESIETRDGMDREFYLSIYDKSDSYSFLSEVGVPSYPVAVNGDKNWLLFIDDYESDKIVIGVYEISI